MSFKKAVKEAMAKSGMSKEEAMAAIASSSRNASPAAKRKNPNLKKVNGKGKLPPKGKGFPPKGGKKQR